MTSFSKARLRAITVALAALSVALPGRVVRAQADDDLTTALSGGVGRSMSRAPALQPLAWREIGLDDAAGIHLKVPFSLCWRGATLAVADRSLAQVAVFTPGGQLIRAFGSRGTAPGQFAELTVVRCAKGRAAHLTADLGAHRVTFFDSVGTVLRTAPLPDVPQIDILGEFALAADGSWYDSWLGSDVTFGPYLSDEQWRSVGLVRRYGSDDAKRGEFGTPVAYRDRVARRVLNRVFYSVWRDTLWTLTQGDATVRGFTLAGAPVPRIVRLPVYFRGADPKVELGEGHAGSDFLPNSMTYDPNVADVAVVRDSLFATIRYRDWGMRVVTGSGVSLRRLASSSIEIVNRRGQVVRAYEAPGMVIALESDGASRLAIIARQRDNTRHVYIADLPR